MKFTEAKVEAGSHTLATYSVIRNTPYLVVFESGLGDGHTVWNKKKITATVGDVLLYDRAGYGKSGADTSTRDIATLSKELGLVIDQFANGRKVILVAHSLGGMIVRDYAIKNPSKIAALLLVDPSHEQYNQLSQATEDLLYTSFKSKDGAASGSAMEARQLVENSVYMATLPPLPDVPVTVLTSMKTDLTHTSADRHKWYEAHEQLKTGIKTFTHIMTTESGHYIQLEQPELVIENIRLLLSQCP